MAIKPPGPHLFRSIPLEVTRQKLGLTGHKSLEQSLNLVAFIDMMTVLVLFLLMTFSANGEILFIQKNITLPAAFNWTDLERAPVIAVTNDVVTLDGRQVATGDDLARDSATGDMRIGELVDELVTAKNNYKLLHPTEDFKGVCVIQADKSVQFKVLKRVMFSAASAGYQNVNFAVRPERAGESGSAS